MTSAACAASGAYYNSIMNPGSYSMPKSVRTTHCFRPRRAQSNSNRGKKKGRGTGGRPERSVHSDARVDLFQRQIKRQCFNPNHGIFTLKQLRSGRESAKFAYPHPCLDGVLSEHAIGCKTGETQI